MATALSVSLSLLLVCAPPTAALQKPLGASLALRTLSAPPVVHPRMPATVCELDPRDEKAAERAETVEYLKTLGGFTFGSIGMFVALTAGAGLEDVAAGNLVLVALCAYGAYLLFFDGGITQAALENQAIRQLAEEEGEIMSAAPPADVGTFAAAAAAAEPTPAVEALERDGFAKVEGVISAETASELLEYVNRALDQKRKDAADDLSVQSANFGDVLMRENRYDFMLDLEPPVRAALGEALPSIAPAVAGTLGEDAELFELAALVSDPRSPRQPVHPDTPYRAGEGAAVVTTFIALQDVDAVMGPTSVIPASHTAEAHERFNNKEDGGRERIAMLREKPNHVGVLSCGDANLIDSRLMHCGGANDSSRRRVLFYLSFRRRGKVTPSGSLLYKLRRAGHALDNTDEWVSQEPVAA